MQYAYAIQSEFYAGYERVRNKMQKRRRVWGPQNIEGRRGTIGESERVKHFSIIPNSRLCEF